MPTSASPTHHVRVTFGYKAKDIPGTIKGAQAHHDGLVANPTLLPGPPVSPPDLQTQITNLSDSQKNFERVGKSAKPARDAAVTPVRVSMRTQVAWVQGLIDLATSEHGMAIAKASGLAIVSASSRVQPALHVAQSPNPGELVGTVGAKAMGVTTSRGRFVEWEWSRDTGATWVSAGHSNSLKYTLTGLPSLVHVMVRARLVINNVPGTWTPYVSIPVH